MKLLPVDVTATSNEKTSGWFVSVIDGAMEKRLGTTIRAQIPRIRVASVQNLVVEWQQLV